MERGFDVFPINPNAESVAGVSAYPDLASVPGGVEAVVIGTRPEHAQATMEQAAALGITRVWMHRSMDAGSVDADAAAWGRAHGITVIEGGCPLMFDPAADGGHKLMCRAAGLREGAADGLRVSGRVDQVGVRTAFGGVGRS